jgi:hypothetical protein
VWLLSKALFGLPAERTGVRVLRKSVYAIGGVMGVFKSSSCFTALRELGNGLCEISEGNDADLGVFKGGNVGFATAVGMMTSISPYKGTTERARSIE